MTKRDFLSFTSLHSEIMRLLSEGVNYIRRFWFSESLYGESYTKRMSVNKTENCSETLGGNIN